MSDNLISRQELKNILEPSANFNRLSEAEQLYIIYSKLQSLEELYLEEKESFSGEDYLISPRQVVTLDKMMEQSNGEHFVEAYFSLLDFLQDDGDNHEDKIYLHELDELYLELKKLILLIEQNVDFDGTLPQLVEDFSMDSMIQFSYTDETSAFYEGSKHIVLNGNVLSFIWKNQEYEFQDTFVIDKIKSVILEYRKELYTFSKKQEKEIGDFQAENYLKDVPTDECVGAIDGIMFSISNQFDELELNDFYSNFKICLYHALEEVMKLEQSLEVEENVPLVESVSNEEVISEESVIATDFNSETVIEETNSYDDRKQKKIIAEMLDISLEDANENSKNFDEMNAVYYWNPEGSSVIIDDNLEYLLTNMPVASAENLLVAYKELKKKNFDGEVVTIPPTTSDNEVYELTDNMIEEINADYQIDRNIDNVFDFSDSLIRDNDLDVFWKRVSADTLGYIIVKELEDNNFLDMEVLMEDINTFRKFCSICVDTELQSKNKQIVNISTMTKQAPEKTLRSIYDVICKNLDIVEIEDSEEEIFMEEQEEFSEYTLLSDLYFNFVVSLPSRFETVTKNSESSFKVGEVNIMLAKCSSVEKLEERATQWITNSATTNSQTILTELDREYYVGVRNVKVLEKQLEKNNKRRIYKFIFFNNAMLIFAYSAQNEELSDTIDIAIESVRTLEIEESQEEVVEQEEARKLIVEHTRTYGSLKDTNKPEAMIEEYALHEDLEISFKDFKIKILEITDTYVRIRIYDNQGIMLANNPLDFKVDYQVGDCVGKVKYNEKIQLYKELLDAGEYWDLRFE